MVDKIAPTNATVLVQGESGTGKELVARRLHERSVRGDKPYVTINCG
ncbi:MAG: Two component, sigma54 specific, transcriptional regulator, Fis family, partial [Candidatus Gottesmanbacteria bacterium GW2011_GWA2_47_9]